VQILASDALIIDELITILAGQALAGGGVGETAGNTAERAHFGSSQRVVASGSREVTA
jgi:hypothetical protein